MSRKLVVIGLAVLLGLLAHRLTLRPRRVNLVLVTIDTLRADHLGSYGWAAAQTPNLDALAARGARFDAVQTPVPITGPSHATILTGLYPPTHGVRDNVMFNLDARHKTLAALLKASGYRTGGFVGAYPVAAAFGFRQGFDDWTENLKESDVPGAGAQRPANEVVDDALAWLGKPSDRPFFAWLHLYDPHAPYTPPEPFRSQFAQSPYDGEIAFTDAQLGRVFAWLRSAGREADTLVAVVADHGESLGEHGELTHAVLVYEATLRVPLILAGPNVPPATVVKPRATTVDLAPTLLRMLDLEPPPEMAGRDLRRAFQGGALPNEPLYAESLFGRLTCRWSALRAWTEPDGWKLVDGARPELFQLADDPNELRDRAAAEPLRVERMRAALRAALAKLAPGGDRPRAARLTPEQDAALRSLGYVGGSSGGGELDEPGLPDPRDQVPLYERLQQVSRVHNMSLEQATAEAAAIAAQDAGNPFAQQTVASLAYRAGRLAAAARAFRHTLELDADYPATRQNYGKLLRDMDQLAESEKQLRIVLAQAGPTDIRARTSLAETLILLGKRDEARRLITEALAIDTHNGEALAADGRLLAAEGQLDAGAERLAAAAAGDPDTQIDLARVYLRANDLGRAQAALEELLRANPGHPWALAVMGETLARQGQREAGLQLLRRAEAVHPRRPQAWLSLASGFDAAGDAAAAARCRRAAQALREG